MAGAPSGLLRHVRRLVAADTTDHLTWTTKPLQRFAATGDEAAFALLVRRHGPMVLGVCRRLLGHEQDAEDVFQAAFLILARKAGTIRRADPGGFLYRVAYRLAVRARASAARRTQRERRPGAAAAADPASDVTWREVRAVVGEELQQLPEDAALRGGRSATSRGGPTTRRPGSQVGARARRAAGSTRDVSYSANGSSGARAGSDGARSPPRSSPRKVRRRLLRCWPVRRFGWP